MAITINGIKVAGIGMPGKNGADGAPGADGAAGANGKSAYQAAKEAGYTGTEAEFNALMYIMDAHASRHESGGKDPLDLAKLAGMLAPEHGGTGVASLDALATALSGKLDGVKIATGSYTGTGTYGASNPCSLTFDFVPFVVFLPLFSVGSGSSFGRAGTSKVIWGYTTKTTGLGDSYSNWNGNTFSFSGTTMQWYGTGDSTQLNQSNNTYWYLAIGQP